MPDKQQANAGLRTALTIFISLAAIILFATVTLAGAPGGVPTSAQPAGGGTPSPTPTPANCIQVWNVEPSANPNANYANTLYGVDAISSNNVWAVGQGQIQHWDGIQWSSISAPITETTEIHSVSGLSANDIWAVGRGDGAGHHTGVILHWDGTQWSNIPNPDTQDESGLYGVTAIGANDVWAVGYVGDYATSEALAIHWDGSTWTIVPTPAPPSGGYQLRAVSAVSSNDVWAVGVGAGGLMMHWDGSAWSVSNDSIDIALGGVVAISHNDVWAVGGYYDGSSTTGGIIHWDGTSWSLVTSGHGDFLFGMAATSANDVWAVGSEGSGTLVMHWDGSTWSDQASPRPFPNPGQLFGISALSPTDAWAVGDVHDNVSGYTSLTIHYNRWCPTPVPCQTGWNVVDAPNPGPDINYINSIDGDSPNDVWAVGAFAILDGGTYTLHWDGSAWNPILIPGVPSETILHGVKAFASNDVWAVGFTFDSPDKQAYSALLSHARRENRSFAGSTSTMDTLIVHWDGTSWTRVTSPNPSTQGNILYSIDGVSANDLWTVGSYNDSSAHALMLHWDGSTWSQVSGPSGNLYSVSAVTSNSVWAVGSLPASSGDNTLIVHWDGSTWTPITSPSPGEYNYLYSISAISASDIWAVGEYDYQALSAHWNGTTWTLVNVPAQAELDGVSAVSADDVYAVGYNHESAQAPILHWDGTSWTEVAHPMPDPGEQTYLPAVLATSANEVWAVGEQAGEYPRTRIERYEASCSTGSPTATSVSGTATPTATATSCATYNYTVSAGTMISGTYDVGNHCDFCVTHLTLPFPVTLYGQTFITATVGAKGWLSFGNYYEIFDIQCLPYSFATYMMAPFWVDQGDYTNQCSACGIFTSTVGTAPNRTFVVEYRTFYFNQNPPAPTLDYEIQIQEGQSTFKYVYGLITSWDGTDSDLTIGVQKSLAENIYTSYYCDEGGHNPPPLQGQEITWTYNSSCATATVTPTLAASSTNTPLPTMTSPPSATSTRTATRTTMPSGTPTATVTEGATSPPNTPTTTTTTPAGSTATATATATTSVGTNTPAPMLTATPTACTTEFRDVPEGSTFYSFIHCLACKGIINGYPDGTFKPNNQVTRGQLSKIVSNSAGFSDTPAGQQFQDVPAGSTFYVYIYRLSSRGYINGYPCGQLPTEPCVAPDNLPYFRPNANSTRGQISKIVSNAAGFSETPVGQDFQDVPVGSTFYDYIYRLVHHNVMSGYPCGQVPSEPCVSPGNLPYFRPNNNATRGQTSKIVANTFFPSCAP